MKKRLFILFFIITILSCIICGCNKKETSLDPYTIHQQLNEYLEEYRKSGLDKEIEDKWYSLNEDNKYVNYEELTGENGTVTVACYEAREPFSYVRDGKLAGIEIDILYHFAKKRGYKLSFTSYTDIGSVMADVASGKSMLGASTISIIEERKLSFCFSDSYFANNYICVALNEDLEKYTSLASLNNKKIGMLSGSAVTTITKGLIENPTFIEYNTITDLALALQRGDIDVFIDDESAFRFFKLTNFTVDKAFNVKPDNYGFIFKKFGYQSVQELKGMNIGSVTGTSYTDSINYAIDNANIKYYESFSDMTQSLSSSKISAFVMEKIIFEEYKQTDSNLYRMGDPFATCEQAVAFEKSVTGQLKCNDFNEFLAEYRESGKLDELKYKWSHRDENFNYEIPYKELPNINGTFTVATCATLPPMEFYYVNQLTGIDIELMYEYCKSRGYALDFMDMTFNGLVAAVSKADCAISAINVTEERRRSILFSDAYFEAELIIVCKTNDDYYANNIFDKIASSFKKTFISESRWKMFLIGILNTVIITCFSILGGLVLGAILFLLNRTGNKVIIKIIDICSNIITGIPVLVVLMVLYYIVFMATSFSSTVVSIIGFSLVFALAIYNKFVVCVESIDKGQFEAAYALGYSKRFTFIRVILPQTRKLFFPGFKAEVVTLIKLTSIAGYIAVQDLTKVGDIIRSRTYEAFFPLIVIAIFYYFLAKLLIAIINLIQTIMNKLLNKRFGVKGLESGEQHD